MSTLASATHITETQLRQLDEDGYFITGVLFDEPTIESMQKEFLRIWQAHIDNAAKTGDMHTHKSAQQTLLTSQLDRISPICDAFCRHPAILEVCQQVVGPDVDIIWNQAILKSPQAATGIDNTFAWHQDMWYATQGTYADDTNPEIFLPNETSITMWIAITRTTVDNGTLWVLPGEHQKGLLPHEKVGDVVKGEWRGLFDTSSRVPAVLRAGQALIFRKYLPHGSGPNISRENRMAYQLSYSLPGVKKVPSKDVSPLLRGGMPVR